jgi:branched-chain amino acid transport system permease protein
MPSFRILFTGLLLAAVLAPWVAYPVFLMQLLCFALFACAYNLLLGFSRILAFGHAAFFGAAAYIAGHAAKVWGSPFELAILAGAAIAALLGFIIGALSIRRHGIYFGMITLALGQLIYFLALQMKFTGGEDGIQAVPRGYFLGLFDLRNQMTMYYVVLAIFVAGFLGIYRTVNSPFGQVLKAIGENEDRAISLGYHVERYKLLAFVLSATFSGVAGATKAIVFQLATLHDINWVMSGQVILMTLLGGIGTMFGPIVGAAVIVTIDNYLSGIGAWITIVTGLIFIVCVLTFRRGIVGELAYWWQTRKAPALAASQASDKRSAAPP